MAFATSKQELAGVIVVDLAGRRAYTIFGKQIGNRVAHTVAGSYGVARVNDRWYGYFGGYTYETNGELTKTDEGQLYPDLYRVDLATGDFQRVALGQSNLRSWLVSPRGEIVARIFYDDFHEDWSLKTGAVGGLTLAKGKDKFGAPTLLGYGRTADRVLVETNGSLGAQFVEYPLNGAAASPATDAESVQSPLSAPDSGLWIGVIHENDELTPELFAAPANARVGAAVKAFPNYFVHLLTYSADFNTMIVHTDGGDDSGTDWLVDVAKHSAVEIGADYPTVSARFVGPVRMMAYTAHDGQVIHAVLTLPPGRPPRNLPLVVMPHGGPQARDYPGFDYWAQAFASRGYAVLQPNFRGSDGYGSAFRDAGFNQWGRLMQTDVSDGAAELARQGIVDPKRACIVGWSYGGYVALAGVTLQHGLYRCAVSMAGVSDLARMLSSVRDKEGETAGLATRYWRNFIGADKGANLSDLSPARQAERADAPILLVHGTDDTVVAPEQSDIMASALKSAGKPVETLRLKGADHWLLQSEARVEMVKASVEFVLRNNPPDPAPGP